MKTSGSKPEGQRLWKLQNRTIEKLVKNQTTRIQEIYQITFDPSHTYSTRRNSRNYQKDMNETTRSI